MSDVPAPEAGHTMLFITRQDVRPGGYVTLSESAAWTRWLHRNVPERIHRTVTDHWSDWSANQGRPYGPLPNGTAGVRSRVEELLFAAALGAGRKAVS